MADLDPAESLPQNRPDSEAVNPPDSVQDIVAPRGTTATADPKARSGVEWILRLFALLVPALYAMGRFYADSWWEGLGLPASLERYAFEDYLFFGFYAVLGSAGAFYGDGLGWRLLQAPLLVALTVLFYLWVNRFLDWFVLEARRLWAQLVSLRGLRWLQSWVRTPYVKVPAASAAITLPLLAGLTTLLYFTLLPLLLAEKAGERDASRLRAKLQDPKVATRFSRVHLPSGGGYPVDARLVQCTPDWCVIFAGGAFHALPKATVLQAGPTRIVPTTPASPSISAAPAAVPDGTRVSVTPATRVP